MPCPRYGARENTAAVAVKACAESPSSRRISSSKIACCALSDATSSSGRLASESSLSVESVEIVTPVAPALGTALSKPKPIVVPILRAGLGMLEGMTRLLPTAEVGFLGMESFSSFPVPVP